MRSSIVLILSLLSLFSGCATVPSAPPQAILTCPRIPVQEDLDPKVAAALERDFTGEMDDFLRGLLPMQNDYKPLSEPAAPSNGLRKKP